MPNAKSQKMKDEEAHQRKLAGEYIAKLRLKQGLSQMELNKRVDSGEYYTFISSVENGRSRLPPQSLATWARALGVKRKTFVKTMMRFYEPYWFAGAFEEEED